MIAMISPSYDSFNESLKFEATIVINKRPKGTGVVLVDDDNKTNYSSFVRNITLGDTF